MAEANKSGIFAKAQKRISRTKTKVLQTLGKADKYTDETFDDLVQKTEKQHDVAHHLQKEIKSYVNCMKALSNAGKSLATALSHTYEEEWTDAQGFRQLLESQEAQWTEYMDSIQTTVTEPMNTYLASFPPLKVRTAKRGRKMVDYDNARHNLEVLQAAKKRDEAKILKAQEDLNESKQIFEELHSELCTELPNFYNSRVTFYASLFHSLFSCENRLHSEFSVISQGLTQTSERLSREHVQFVYTPKRPISKSLSDNSDEQPMNGDSSPRVGSDSPASSVSPAATPTTPTAAPRPPPPSSTTSTPLAPPPSEIGASSGGAAEASFGRQDSEHLYGNQEAVLAANVNGDTDKVRNMTLQDPEEETTTSLTAEDVDLTEDDFTYQVPRSQDASPYPLSNEVNGPESSSGASDSNVYEAPRKADGEEEEESDEDESAVYESPPSNKPVYEPPPDTLYQVEATHSYKGEDIDELSFEPGDIIYVVTFENEEEQDEGWQMGIKQKDGVKGVFPENFTRRL